MSYVLEALRRAEAERQRGRVPGLDAQPLPAPDAGPARARAARPGRWWPAAVAVAAVGAGLAWWLLQPAATVPPAPPVMQATAPSPRPAPPRASPPPPLPTPRPPAARPAVQEPPAPAPAADGRIPRLQDLPEATRRQVPPLSFGGATDSPVPAARMLIVNGQVFREGDEPAPGLTLERITLRAAQFRWRGQRFEVAY